MFFSQKVTLFGVIFEGFYRYVTVKCYLSDLQPLRFGVKIIKNTPPKPYLGDGSSAPFPALLLLAGRRPVPGVVLGSKSGQYRPPRRLLRVIFDPFIASFLCFTLY